MDVSITTKDDPTADRLKTRLERVQAEQPKAASYYLCLALGAALIAVFLLVAANHRHPIAALACLLIGIVLLAFGLAMRAGWHEAEEEINRLEGEIELYSGPDDYERRAQKLLRLNQDQLRRYYKQNLSQNSKVFAVGVCCIVLGIAVIGATLYALGRIGPAAWQEKLIVGVVGAVGAILTNYVAAIYLKMHAAISASLTVFHSKLVESDRLYLANLLVAAIPGQERRCEAFAAISTALLGRSEGPKAGEPVTALGLSGANKDG